MKPGTDAVRYYVCLNSIDLLRYFL